MQGLPTTDNQSIGQTKVEDQRLIGENSRTQGHVSGLGFNEEVVIAHRV
jgi:hypothetical protein